MISKAKALFYYAFKPQTKLPPMHIPVKWYHKLILVHVGRFPKIKDVPETVSQFDWLRAQQDFGVFVRRVRYWSAVTVMIIITFGYRYHYGKHVEEEYAKHRAAGMSDVPYFTIGEENEFIKDYISE